MNIDYKVETYVMKEFEEIHQHVFIAGEKLATEVMSLRDKATREALIKMGWTPPKEEEVCSETSHMTKEDQMQIQAINECIDYIDKILEKLYYEHVEQFTYMMETPYNYHYWCELFQPVLYNQREELLDCLIELRNLK